MKILRVAILGSGPAGLMCADKLNLNGFKVTVFDGLNEFGGMLAYGIPEFRLPLNLVKKRINEAKKYGILFENKKIQSIKNLLDNTDNSFIEKFDLVILAIGAGTGVKAGFVNENSTCVIDALDFLLETKLNNKKMINQNELIGVIGGGNSAIDAARVAKKQGADVKIIYRRTENEMPALKKEIEDAKKELIDFEFLLAPKELILNDLNKKNNLICSVMKLGEVDESGRKKPVESNKTKKFVFDKIIVAVGQKNDFSWLNKEGIKTNKKSILVDKNYLTSMDNVYACGDAITGAKTIKEAVITANNCVECILKKYLV